jgi:hypothetical protein
MIDINAGPGRRRPGQTTVVLGIDPGVRGAAAICEFYTNTDGMRVQSAMTIDLPQMKYAGMTLLDTGELARLLMTAPAPVMVVIEEPIIGIRIRNRLGNTEMVRTSAATTRTTMVNYGRLQTVIERWFGAIWQPVQPSKWKRHMLASKDKAESVRLARMYYPMLAHELADIKRTDGRAEALLLAAYAYRALVPAALKGEVSS